MSGHTKLHSKADFDKAIATKDKYVLIHAYSGSILDKAESFAVEYATKVDAYAVDTAEEPKTMEYFKISEVPAAMLYKDGELVKKVEGRNAAGMSELIAVLG